ncbi:MAG: Xaa-Pro aminopeptidase [Bacteroidales bacterium]|jgi:Xaa-Pro aminopeptidase|nr:Xaa-Pro aminopeptidase [Bacteroidales bacterium]
MRHSAIPTQLFSKNQKKILAKLPEHALGVLQSQDQMPRNGDQFHKYRQDSDFFYASGIEQEKSIVLFIPFEIPEKQVQLFILAPNPELEMWEGSKLSFEEASRISGISEIHYTETFDIIFSAYALKADCFYINKNENPRFSSFVQSCNDRFRKVVQLGYPHKEIHSFAPIMTECRISKEPEEIELIRTACGITRTGFLHVLSETKAGMKEYEVEALLTSSFISNGAYEHAFEPIIAQGKNACYLHYTKNTDTLENGNLLFMDFGAEYANYASDCSRSFPISGTFSKRQEEVYSAVLSVLKDTQRLIKPGTSIRNYHQQACLLIQEELLKLKLISTQDIKNQDPKKPAYSSYFMHGVSHFLGLDTHDVGDKDVILEPGMLVTCEPGIYIPAEGIGIRLENDILLTPEGNENLTANIPIEIEELYTHMK